MIVLKYSIIFIVLVLDFLVAYWGFQQIRSPNVRNTLLQKVRKSILFGMILCLFICLSFTAILVFLWDGSKQTIAPQSIFTLLGCIVVPFFVIGSIGGFIQLSYYEYISYHWRTK